jgi:predicted DNA-binding transcriptional regulator AlpA
MSDKSYSVNELAKVEGVSRAFLYKLWGKNEGPEYYQLGNRRRITEAQRQKWHAKRTVSSEVR